MAFNQETQTVIAVGDRAYDMIGKVPPNVIVTRPLKNGVITDYQTTMSMIQHFLTRTDVPIYKNIRLLIGIPYGITNIEQRAVVDAASMAGAKECFLIEEPIAAAIGSGYDVFEPNGQFIVDIGGGTTEVAVISL